MEIMYASLNTQSEHTTIFKEVLRKVSDEAEKLPGCLKYDWFNHPEDNSNFVIYAEFDTDKSYLSYKKSNALKLINQDLFPLLAEEPVFKHFRASMVESHNV